MSPTIPILVLSLAGLFTQFDTKSLGTKPKWQQIVVMRSTREDVVRLLGQSKYEGSYTSYKVEDGVLSIEYYPFHFCTSTNSYLKVQQWTVVGMTYEPDNPPTLGELKLDLKRFRKLRESPHVPELITYIDDEDGVAYTFQADNTLNDVRYFPARRYDALHCKRRKTKRLRF